MSLQKYIDAAKAMQSAPQGTEQWVTAANVFRDMPYAQIAALLIEADSLLPKWRDISEAPKDGTPLLGYMPSYYQDKGGQSVIVWLKDGWYDNRAFKTTPTHFMPYPGAPR